MFKITIIGIDGSLITTVERVGKIVYIDDERGVFTATFNGCNVKVKHDQVRIRNARKRTEVRLLNYEFGEISIV